MRGMRFAGYRKSRKAAASGAIGLLALALAGPVKAQDTQPQGADLTPFSDTECVRGVSCVLEVTIENRGDADFGGTTGLRGAFDPSVKVESVVGETRGLKCAVKGEGAYECLGSVRAVKPGAAALVQVVIDIPADYGPGSITHTKEMIWPDAAGKDFNAENDRHVSTISIIDPAMLPAVDLAIETGAEQDSCTAGGECRFTLAVTNNGPAEFDGAIEVSVTVDSALTQLTGSKPSGWSCLGSGGRYACTLRNANLAVAETQPLVLSLTASSLALGELQSCVEVSRRTTGHVADIQRALNEAGFEAGPVDGVAGRRTRAAISAYQEANGLAVTGEIDTALLQKPARPVEAARHGPGKRPRLRDGAADGAAARAIAGAANAACGRAGLSSPIRTCHFRMRRGDPERITMSITFEGQVAIVTGAGNGLGRSHALALAKRGARLVDQRSRAHARRKERRRGGGRPDRGRRR
jgi:peptidoglycan hydrolase-like protein with peptidoglycan-binding domain